MSKATENKRRREKRRKKHDLHMNKLFMFQATIQLLEQSLNKLRKDNDILAGQARYYQMIKLAVKVAEERVRVLAEWEVPNMLLNEPKKYDYGASQMREEYLARKIAYCPPGATSYIQILNAMPSTAAKYFLENIADGLGLAIARDIFTHLINNTRIV